MRLLLMPEVDADAKDTLRNILLNHASLDGQLQVVDSSITSIESSATRDAGRRCTGCHYEDTLERCASFRITVTY